MERPWGIDRARSNRIKAEVLLGWMDVLVIGGWEWTRSHWALGDV